MSLRRVAFSIFSNYLGSRNCAFVNFTNISNAIKAIDGIKNKPEYANLRVAHGKDRCANPPRSGPQGGGSMRRSASNTHANGVHANEKNGAGDIVNGDGLYMNGAIEGDEPGLVADMASCADAQEMHIDVGDHLPQAVGSA